MNEQAPIRSVSVLTVDLAAKSFRFDSRQDLSCWLGGAGLALALFAEDENMGAEALQAESPFVMACGPLSFIFPVVTKTVSVFRSPLTGELGESHAGGRLALAMRSAGMDALVVHGKAKAPVWLEIGEDRVLFHNAEPLWGRDCIEAGRWMRELSQGRSFRSTLRIGQAGENLCSYAGVNVDTYRHFGRMGLGAVYGSKQLKGIVVSGEKEFAIPDIKLYNRVYNAIYKKCVETDVMKKYHELGTAINVLPLNAMNALPTHNMQSSSFAGAAEMSGEAFAEHNLVRKVACSGCPIGCVHIALLRREFDAGYEYESVGVPYDYEPLFSAGSYIGVSNREQILSIIEATERYGLDVISACNVLGWATEAMEKGLISEQQLGVKLAFGDAAAYLEALHLIAEPKNDLHRALSRGSKYLGEKFGGEGFAMQIAGNEMPGYFTGYGYLLGCGVGARHSHLDNAGYSFDQEMKQPDDEQLVDRILAEEKWRGVLTSLCICLFARKVYDEPTVLEALGAVGIDMDSASLAELGERIFRLKVDIKKRLGFDYNDISYAERFFETQCMHGKLDREKLGQLRRRWMQKAEVED